MPASEASSGARLKALFEIKGFALILKGKGAPQFDR